MRRILAAIALAIVGGQAAAGLYIDEAQCFSGSVPGTVTGLSSSTTVTTSSGMYQVTAWRQPCTTNSSAGVLMLKFQATAGSPSVSSLSVYITQAGRIYQPSLLVKAPLAVPLIQYAQIGSFTAVDTIVEQRGERFDPNGRLVLGFINSSGSTTTMTLQASPTAPASASIEPAFGNATDMWWDPAESGTGMSIIQHGSNQLFSIWYAYSETGEPMWIVFPGGTWETTRIFSGALYRVRGTPFNRPWNPSDLQVGNSVGTGRLTFTAADAVTFSYTVNGTTGTKTFTRQGF